MEYSFVPEIKKKVMTSASILTRSLSLSHY